MRHAMLVVGLALVGCSAAGEGRTFTDTSSQPLWIPEGQLGHVEQAKWGLPLPFDTTIEVQAAETFWAGCLDSHFEPCPEGTKGYTWGARIVLRGDVESTEMSLTLLHEMGHVLRGTGGHVPCTRCENVMCAGGRADITPAYPTAADFDFVLGN